MFTNNGSTLQTDITTFGVNMKLAHLGRQALMGVMAVALVAGMSVKSFADEGLLNKVKERGTLLVGLEGILLDPVYTGKAMAGLIGGISQKRFKDEGPILFIHTGGAPALFAYHPHV